MTEDITPCETALTAPVAELYNATTLFRAKKYEDSVKQFAAGLDGIAKAIGSDSCGLRSVATVINQVVPKLANATVKIESSETVKILVGSVDLYDNLYSATEDIEQGP